MSTFTDRTLVVSGGSRGIGLAIALGAAKHGANVVLLAKTAEPHPKLPGTVHTAVSDVEAAGGKGVAVVGANAAGFTLHLLPAFGTILAIVLITGAWLYP